jgi:hypothetical protein
MLVEAYAAAATRAGAGLGLSDLVLREMHRIRAAATQAPGDPAP